MTREEAIKIINCYDIGFYDLSGAKIPADKLAEAFDMAIEALSAKPKTEMVLCALADRACPFQGKEYAWCLTCPHISEEDRALVKKSVAEPKAGCIPVSDVRKLQDIVWMSIDSLEGTRNIVEAGMLSAWKEVAEYVDGMLGEDGEE